MIKRILFLIILGLNYSCFHCDHYGTTQGGLRSKRFYKKYLNNRIDPRSVNIKTDIVYKSIKYYYDESKSVFSKITDSVNLKKDFYSRFFENGTYYGFTKKRNEKLNIDSFDPQKGDIGFLIKRGKRFFFMDYSTVNCGGFSKIEFEVKGDTLISKYGNNKGYRMWYYSIKHKVPANFLNVDTKI